MNIEREKSMVYPHKPNSHGRLEMNDTNNTANSANFLVQYHQQPDGKADEHENA